MPSEDSLQPILNWAAAELGGEVRAEPLAGDASLRRYLRLTGRSHLLMLSPPSAGQGNDAFLSVRKALAAAGVRVPALAASDLRRGWFLLEDLGEKTLAAALQGASCGDRADLLGRALDLLPRMRRCRPEPALPSHGPGVQRDEMQLWLDWYQRRLLGRPLGGRALHAVEADLAALVAALSSHARDFAHFDFHAFNLMVLEDGELAALDFQDAVVGSVALDLVSLVKDCYRLDPLPLRERLVERAARQARDGGEMGAAQARQLPLWVEQSGLQRHLRVLGVFARLHLRDGKPSYLGDLPLVLRYAREAAEGLGLGALHEALCASETPLLEFLAPFRDAGRAPRSDLEAHG